MGWRFRRSKKLGPFRFTLSKRGVSTSTGVRGFRVSRRADGRVTRTVSVPGTGISTTDVVSPPPEPEAEDDDPA